MKIRECNWEDIKQLYEKWESFSKDDPTPKVLDLSIATYDLPHKKINQKITIIAEVNNVIIGTCTLFDKKYEHIRIGGIGKMAVDPLYRKNGIAKEMLLYMKNVMEKNEFDISVLWASVLKVYESVGYKAYYKNMMILPVKEQIKTEMLLNLFEMPSKIGHW